MTIIVDSNVLIAALIKPGIVRQIIPSNPGEWLVPEDIFEEVWEHREVWNRNDLPEFELHEILDMLSEDYMRSPPARTFTRRVHRHRQTTGEAFHDRGAVRSGRGQVRVLEMRDDKAMVEDAQAQGESPIANPWLRSYSIISNSHLLPFFPRATTAIPFRNIAQPDRIP